MAFTPVRSGLLQRKCACGGTPGPTGECEECRKKRLTGSNGSQRVSRPVPLADKEVRAVEVGHTDCDWDRAVKPDEPFKPRSGNPKVNLSGDKCTLPCTAEHEAVHVEQVKPICTSYFTCYTGASAKAKEEKDCKEMPKLDERKKCEELYTDYFRLQCFLAVGNAWDAEAWECAAYKKSRACAEKELARGEKDCQGKLKEYKESAQKQIAKYCKPEKEKEEKGKKPEASKEPDEPKKPAEPEKPKEPEKKPKEPKEVLFGAGTLQRASDAGAGDKPEAVPPIVSEVLRSQGQALDTSTRVFMESRFGHDFSQVRVHTDVRAAESARAVNARAYTIGRDIAFGAGQFSPATKDGKALLAHELAHTIQQTGRRVSSGQIPMIAEANSRAENEAEAAALSVAQSLPFPVTAYPPQIARVKDETAPLSELGGQTASEQATPEQAPANQGPSEPEGQHACVVTETIPKITVPVAVFDGEVFMQTEVEIQWKGHERLEPIHSISYCDCACGEYRQYVKGHILINGTPYKHPLCDGAILDETVWHEDGDPAAGNFCPGHRDRPPNKNDVFDQPNREWGCHYVGKDQPRVPGPVGAMVDVDLNFKGQTYDKCTNKFGQIHTWTFTYKGPLSAPSFVP